MNRFSGIFKGGKTDPVILDQELIASNHEMRLNEAFTPYDIDTDIIMLIRNIQRRSPDARNILARAIMSCMLNFDELFLDYQPKGIHDALLKQLLFWSEPVEVRAAASIHEMRMQPALGAEIDKIKNKYNYGDFGRWDKVFVESEIKNRPFIQEYFRYETKGNFWYTPNPILTNPAIQNDFDKHRRRVFLHDLSDTMKKIDAERRATPDNNYYGSPNDIPNGKQARRLYNILIGNININEIGNFMFGRRLQEKLRG
ncbi:MAG: hypothetical protein LBJ73_03920 [Rickettsiales bacterium]|jgi:hypothetical protein|nr:hypothetical protein [Rickettsiales bacterium]